MNKIKLIILPFLLWTSALSGQNSLWEKVPGPLGGTIEEIFPTVKPDTIYGRAGISFYRSIDNGATWNPFTIGFAGTPVQGTMHVGSKGTFFLKPVYSTDHQLYKSSDEGITWQVLRDSVSSQYLIRETAAGTLIEVERYGTVMKIARSTDGGLSWTEVLQHDIYTAPGNIPGVISEIIEFPDGKLALKSWKHLYWSADDGQNWTPIQEAGLNEKLAVTAAGSLLLYGNSGYYHRSTDAGTTWDSLLLTGQPANLQIINSLLTLPSGRILCAQTSGNEFFYSDDDGLSWATQTGDRHADLLLCLQNGDILGKDSLLYRSGDEGLQWSPSNAGICQTTIYSIEFANANTGFIRTNDGVWRTLDGASWTRIVPGYFGGIGNLNNRIAIGGAQNLLVDASDFEPKILWSEDWGDSFLDITPSEAGTYPFFVSISPGDSFLFTTGLNGLLRSADHGITWESVMNDYQLVVDMIYHPSGRYFALTWGQQMLCSDDSGQTWQLVPNFPGSFEAYSMSIGPTGTIYVRDLEHQLLARSSDNGETWQNSTVPVSFNLYHQPLLENAAGHFLAGDQEHIVLSADEGVTWQTLPGQFEITSYALGPDQYFYLGLWSDGLYRTKTPTTQGAYLRGHIRKDADAECTTPNAQQPLMNWAVSAAGEFTYHTTTGPDGAYLFFIDTGAYSVKVQTPQSLWWSICDNNMDVFLDSLLESDSLDFAALAASECPLMTVDVAMPLLRRCFDNTVYVQYCNQGSEPADSAWVDVTLDPYMTLVSSAQPHASLGNQVYRFFLGDVASGDCGQFTLKAYVDCDSTVLGQTHCVTAHGYPDTLCTTVPNWSGAVIEAMVECQDSLIRLKLRNAGNGPSQTLDYIIIEDDVVLMTGDKQYDENEELSLDMPANGHTWRIESEQEPGHPFSVQAVAFAEGCGGFESLGFINQFSVNTFQPSWNTACVENTGSYDPNDKQGFPLGFGTEHRIRPGQELEYMIRFQNTGTDTAFNIVILDSLSAWLDPATLRPGAASHPYTWELSGQGVLRFTFANVLLPDSNTNLAGSQGFVQFTVKQQPEVPLGTQIRNTAAIYFDFNLPVITNQTLHTVGDNIFVGTNAPQSVHNAGFVTISPNPVQEEAVFQLKNGAFNRHRITVSDAYGRVIRSVEISGKQYLFQRKGLPPGAYFFRVEDAKGQRVDAGILMLGGG